MKSDTLFLIDRHSFPLHCGELEDFLSLVEEHNILEVDTESPTSFFNQAVGLVDQYELIVPVTRNLFIRDRLRQEGVSLVVCL